MMVIVYRVVQYVLLVRKAVLLVVLIFVSFLGRSIDDHELCFAIEILFSLIGLLIVK